MITQIFQHPPVTRTLLLAALTLGLSGAASAAKPVYSVTTFALGSSIAASNPTGVTYDGTDIWVSYVNTAAQDGSSGSSTVAEYDTRGNILNTYVVPGYVEGLRWNSTSGVIWAMQNPGGNPTVTTIKPGSGIVAGSPVPFAIEAATRGYANVDFQGPIAYLSYTHPVNPTDPTLQQISGAKAPLRVAPILTLNSTGTNITTGATAQPTLQNDPHCLRGTPTKNQIVMSSSNDGQLIFVANIGSETQSVSFLNVINAIGENVKGINDVIYNNSTTGTFYVAVAGSNLVLAISATGLDKNSLYGTVGSLTAFTLIDPVLGTVIPIIAKLAKPTGMTFVGR